MWRKRGSGIMSNWRCISTILSTLLLTACSGTSRDLEDVINEYEYIRLVPASDVYSAGSLVFRETYDPSDTDPKNAAIGSLCIDEFAVDLYPVKPKKGASETVSLSRLSGAKIKVDGPSLGDILDVEAAAEASEAVSISIGNVSVEAYSLEDLRSIGDLLGPRCKEIVNENIESGNAYQIRETLTATIKVELKLKAGVSAELKQTAISELQGIGVTVDSGTTASVTGSALVYGIKWEQLTRKLR